MATLNLTRQQWAAMGLDFDASWVRVGPRVTLLAASAQLGAARNGAASVPAMLAELDQSVAPLGEVDPRGFVGVASDGRPLDSLMYGAVTTAKAATLTMDPPAALAAGGRFLDMAVQTQVADAGRGAAGVAITSRPRVGWIRMTGGKPCSRCAVLAGKFYRFNQGFQRHPSCSCMHIPTSQGEFSSLTSALSLDSITGLSKADRTALSEGADLGQVVNAKRGASGMTTSEGITRHGVAGQRLGAGRQRLTPAGIYRIASDRTEAVALLQAHGYLL